MKQPSTDLDQYAINVLAEEGRQASDLGDAVALARAVIGSPLWRRGSRRGAV